jgi:exodeoxyribonuclease III
MQILSWNINGIRAVDKKGFYPWLQHTQPDILLLQETKADADHLPNNLRQIPGYHTYWNPADRKGYSGVATLSKTEPLKVHTGFGIPEFDKEGRILITEHPDFTVFNIYFPNGKQNKQRLDYKLRFYDAFLTYIDNWRDTHDHVIIGGDVNTAHHDIDIARPGPNSKISGFLPIERQWMDTFESHGYTDTFRHFHKDPDHYTFWDQRTKARERNIGWRVDYIYVDNALLPKIKKAYIMPDVTGSDHCPIGIDLIL